jgi:cobyrinic acid a,c-diamide synthase
MDECLMSRQRVVLAGTHSGVGKTTVTLALMAALRRRGLRVQPFKVGPDFIDPGHHTAVCGRPSYNLDTWMMPDTAVRQTFHRAAVGADCAVIEGVMGLFDGRGPDDPRGSTAHLARLLDVPVVLVVDASGVAGSIAALVKGYSELEPALRVVGVICNRVAGARHWSYLEPALRRHTRVAPLGWLPRRAEWEIPVRHLGLVTQEDLRDSGWKQRMEALALALEETVDVALLIQQCTEAKSVREPSVADLTASLPRPRRRVAVARDAAFCFYYPENLDRLQAAGAELVPFSPLRDRELPLPIDLLYLGGGYPEVHAERLAGNREVLAAIRRFHRDGGSIYAECGGLMYCGRELVDTAERKFPMLDLLPVRTVMQRRLAALGYVRWQAQRTNLLGPSGTEVRGHEYHYSRLEPLGPLHPTVLLEREGQEPRPDGYCVGALLAGYAHLHFASHPAVVGNLLGPARSDTVISGPGGATE